MPTHVTRIATVIVFGIALAGCTVVVQKGTRTDAEKIERLSGKIDELANAKKQLEEQLAQEISDKQVKIERLEKGLVITFVADILFDSGKAKIKPEAMPSLGKIGTVLNDTVPLSGIGIEGHTDNQPIQYSGWKSNWELSTARALSVLHYLIDEKGVAPQRVSAIGYGEYRPVASNETAEGRQANRRVEIVILPRMTKEKPCEPVTEPLETAVPQQEENLK